MPLNHYVTLGRSGLRVSPLCLGAMTFGLDWGWGTDVQDSKDLIDAYLDRGGNFIDTANIYTKGHAEKILGDHLGRHKSKRDRVVIATKFQGNMFPGDPNAGGGSRLNIINSCEESLRRLQTDHIDLYWMHFWDRLTPIDETMRALDDLVRQGKVRYLGFSDTPAWVCVQAQYEAIFRNMNTLCALQIEYSLAQRSVEADLIPMAMANGLGVTPWSPLKGGQLSGKYTRDTRPDEGRAASGWNQTIPDRVFDIVDALIEIGQAVNATPAQVALRWVQDRPGVASTIVGARTMEQLTANLDALDLELPAEATERLDEASEPDLPFPHQFLENARTVIQGGATIDGQTRDVWDLAPQSDAERH